MTKKRKILAAAVCGFVSGVAVMAILDRLLYRNELEFLGIVRNLVEEGIEELRGFTEE